MSFNGGKNYQNVHSCMIIYFSIHMVSKFQLVFLPKYEYIWLIFMYLEIKLILKKETGSS